MLCVLMVEDMSVVVNVIFFLMSVMSPPHALCSLSVRTMVRLCTWSFCFRGEFGFLNCDEIGMCVVNKHFDLLEFVLNPFMLTWGIMRFISLFLIDWCACVVCVVMWSSLVCL